MASKLDVRLIVRITDSSSFGDVYNNLNTEVVYRDEEGYWSTTSGYSTPQPLRGYYGLGICAQADKYKAEFYGGQVVYSDVHRADLGEVKLMAATITRVARKIDKLNAEFGYPKTVADSIIRFAKAVPCTGNRVFGWYDKQSPNQDDRGYVWTDAAGLEYKITRAQEEFVKKYSIAPRES